MRGKKNGSDFRKQAYQYRYMLTTPKKLTLQKDRGTLCKKHGDIKQSYNETGSP